MLFLQWLQLPVWEQVRQLRIYRDQEAAPTMFDRQEWTYLVPAGEPWVSRELFLDDLAWIFSLLVTMQTANPSMPVVNGSSSPENTAPEA